MSLAKETSKVVQSTETGRMYINTSDFFKQAKIQEMVKQMVESDIFKTIEKSKLSAK